MYVCSACGARFGGERGFALHRVGAFARQGNSRRCLDAPEILDAGYTQDARGVWVRAFNDADAKSAVAGTQKGHISDAG